MASLSSLSQRTGFSTCLSGLLRPQTTSRRTQRLVARAEGDEDEFEARLAKLRKKSGSGTGKKAEERRARKEGTLSGDGVAEAGTPTVKKPAVESLPPVPLEDPISGGLPVTLGFSPYSERLNGQMALIGLAALLSIELYTGGGLFNFHDGATIGVQLYFLAGLGALYVKFEKEKSSVWPK